MGARTYYVYLLASRSRNLYTGVKNNLKARVLQHKHGPILGFTRRYRIHRLVHFEVFSDVREAIRREKQIKSWRRAKRLELMAAHNPAWNDLAADWHGQEKGTSRFLASLGMTVDR